MILALDIGGSKIRAVWRTRRKILKRAEFATPKNKKTFLALLKKFSRAGRIEIGIAGVISGTKVVFSPNIRYLRNFDFQKIFPKTILCLDNDARVFLREKLREQSAGKHGARKILAFTIGTGIGRAYAEKGKVKKIKKLEYPEKWEKEYQKIHDLKKLSEFLGEKLSVLIKKYKPETIVLGGGVLKKKNFAQKLGEELKARTCIKFSI